MESIERTISELSNHFKTTMAEFQQSLSAGSTASPISDLVTQFGAFRSFVLAALETLNSQMGLLIKQTENMEMRSRRKMLLVHGVPECSDEKVTSVVVKVLSDHIKLPEINVDNVNRCQRLGKRNAVLTKPRAILIKFKDLPIRNKLWFSKTSLKGTGITMSEFLTKERHDLFVASRERFGVNKCWSNNGNIIVLANGRQHRVTSLVDLIAIDCTPASCQNPVKASTSSSQSNSMSQRPKRNTRK